MTRKIHLWPEEHRLIGDRIEVPAVLEKVSGKRTRLYFRVPAEERANLTPAADPFVLATSFYVMSRRADLQVHGTVSPSLLRGLEEFQIAWCRWRPDRYQQFSVSADLEQEQTRESSGRTLMTFSGGVDSCCTAWRHTRGDLGRRKRGLDAAVMAHGFDIPIEQDEVFTRAVASSKAILDTIGVPLIPVASNIRVLQDTWVDSHGSALAAILHLFSGGYSTGLIASSHVYQTLRIPWGSSPLTDPLLANASLDLVHDGCDLTRWEKVDEIGDWDAVQQNLRICWAGEHLDRNCGTCMRCVGTAICFAAVGRPIPPSIPVPSAEEALLRLRALKPTPVQLGHFENMVLTARKHGISDPWVGELAQFIPTHCHVGLFDAFRQRLRRRKKSHSQPQAYHARDD